MYSFEKSEIMKKVKKLAKNKSWLINFMETFLDKHGYSIKYVSKDVVLHIFRSELLYVLDSNASMVARLKNISKELDGVMLDEALNLYFEIFVSQE